MRKMFIAGAHNLSNKKEIINDLNVFPVPDGDTGTNMTLTIMSAVEEVGRLEEISIKTLCKAISSGSLRGARGNSGVILSQLLRGFTRGVREESELTAPLIAAAMQRAVDTAYKAVIKPKEGTILTVAKAMAEKAAEHAEDETDLTDFFDMILTCGDETLAYTPELLPVLKEAGVVDSGGKGLMTILHGMIDVFNGKEIELSAETAAAVSAPSAPARVRGPIETDNITFGYCTEFIVMLNRPFSEEDEDAFKSYLSSIGDSLVLVSDDEIVKIHVHTNDPGLALQKGLEYGELTRLKIDNMREEHRETIFKNGETERAAQQAPKEEPSEWKETAFLSVCAGEGLAEIFRQLGTDGIISGGQSMNPSTDDLLKAIREVHAHTVYVLPNNKNIILAAQQAADLTKDCRVIVVPTKTIPQGIAALVAYLPDSSPEENLETIREETAHVKSGEITYAVRNTRIDGRKIRKGDIIGIGDAGLLASGSSLTEVAVEMCRKMTDEDSELISIYTGADFDGSYAEELRSAFEEAFPELDLEIQDGGQPVYYCILSVE